VSSVDAAKAYYAAFKRLQEEAANKSATYKPLRVATIFSFAANEEPRQPGGCKLKTAPVRPVVAARPAEYVCSEDLFY
ncbi:hypothetical protein TZR29_004892, partial [Escherichia coli]|nr:hypothetical protein [Escherichia coli]